MKLRMHSDYSIKKWKNFPKHDRVLIFPFVWFLPQRGSIRCRNGLASPTPSPAFSSSAPAVLKSKHYSFPDQKMGGGLFHSLGGGIKSQRTTDYSMVFQWAWLNRMQNKNYFKPESADSETEFVAQGYNQSSSEGRIL
ncbi:hypothetical protein Taro_019455 [Colocasia esculenta]|uniref:Uncharacterized protein n=1 Tax=Colocasia esculenta TaxID=4460 RepID=A0A843UTJ1_COLES|nr:hypothetical protein [Colocasia esculenta]